MKGQFEIPIGDEQMLDEETASAVLDEALACIKEVVDWDEMHRPGGDVQPNQIIERCKEILDSNGIGYVNSEGTLPPYTSNGYMDIDIGNGDGATPWVEIVTRDKPPEQGCDFATAAYAVDIPTARNIIKASNHHEELIAMIDSLQNAFSEEDDDGNDGHWDEGVFYPEPWLIIVEARALLQEIDNDKG